MTNDDQYENHHVAGKRNADSVVSLCVRCHRCVSQWQVAAGIGLREKPYADVDRIRAYYKGIALVAELACRIYGRIVDRALDESGGQRDHRWSPNPTVNRDPDRGH